MMSFKNIVLCGLVSFFVSCGGESATSFSAKLLDSAVEGITYECDNFNGSTATNGSFVYDPSCGDIKFKVGGVVVGDISAKAIPSDNKVYITDLVGTPRQNISNAKVVKILRFLQSVDSDANPDNGIKIQNSLKTSLENSTLDLTDDATTISEIDSVVSSVGKTLVTAQDAVTHFENTLKNNGDFSEIKLEVNTDKVDVTLGGLNETITPKVKVTGTGNEIISLGTLKKGIYLYSFKYQTSVDVNNIQDAGYIQLENLAGESVQHMSFPNNSNDLKQMYLSKDGIYNIKSSMVYQTDTWEFVLIHEDELSNSLRATITPHRVNSIEKGSDILFKKQWHLENTGQSHAIENAVAGNDIDVIPVWNSGITGKGIRVAIVDEGVEINHPDLVDNMDIKSSWNFNDESHDTTPTDSTHAHGTAVAGIVAASWKNGIGGRGVAPEATIISYNLLDSQSATSFPLPFAILDGKRGDAIDIFNNSWDYPLTGEYANGVDCNGSEVTLFPFDSTATGLGCSAGDYYCGYENQLQYGTKHGRDSKGSVYIKSAGNSAGCNHEGVRRSYMNSNWYPDQVERFMFVVGASKANGYNSEYSTPGVNLLINAPGGAAQLSYLRPNELMVVTTDLTSAAKGYDNDAGNIKLGSYHFDVEGNENHDYSDRMNGTSAAGPVVSGVVALMLEARPELTWRDVKYILATTTTKNPTSIAENLTYTPNNSTLAHTYSRYYGFGRVNANAAVNLAKTFTLLGDEQSESAFSSDVVSDQSVATATFNITQNLKIEYINVEFGIDSTLNIGEHDNIVIAGENEFTELDKINNKLYKVYFELLGAEDNSTGENKPSNQNVAITLKNLSGGADIAINSATLFRGNFPNTFMIETVIPNGVYALQIDFADEAHTTSRGTASVTLTHGGIQYANNLQINLTSPSGTVSRLVDAPNFIKDTDGDNKTTIAKTRMGINQFLDEDSNGVWTLTVTDVSKDFLIKPIKYTHFIVNNLKLEVHGR